MAISLTTAQRAVGQWLPSSGVPAPDTRPGAAPEVSLVAVSPGMSGAVVFDCRLADGGRYALKAWPAETDRSRMQQVHQVIGWVRKRGCEFVPELRSTAAGATIVASGGRLWELAEWMPGQPLAPSAVLTEIRAGAAAIGRFHASAAQLGVTKQPAPAVAARLRRLQQLSSLVPAAVQQTAAVESDPALTDALGRAARLLGEHWPAASQRIAHGLAPWAETPVETHFVLRDIHREHLLFRGRERSGRGSAAEVSREISGLIDFDALRIDAPACDLARWVGGFLAGRSGEAGGELWQAAVAGFEQIRPFAIQHQRLARELLAATHWISLANWLVWLNVERRWFPAGPAAVADRIEQLLELCSSSKLGSRPHGPAPWR